LSQLKKQRLEAAGSSGAVQALRKENDAPVVGPDAPTANSKMVKLDIATTAATTRTNHGKIHTQSIALWGRFIPSEKPNNKAEAVCKGKPGISVRSQLGHSDLDGAKKLFRKEAVSNVAIPQPTITPKVLISWWAKNAKICLLRKASLNIGNRQE
jgi:hypothetical protein